MVLLMVIGCIIGYLLVGSAFGAGFIYLFRRHLALCGQGYRSLEGRQNCWCKIEVDDDKIFRQCAWFFSYGAWIVWPLSLVAFFVVWPIGYYIVRPIVKYVLAPAIIKPIEGIGKLYDKLEKAGDVRGEVLNEQIKKKAVEAENERLRLQQLKAKEEEDKKKYAKVDAALERAGKLVDRIDRGEGYDGE